MLALCAQPGDEWRIDNDHHALIPADRVPGGAQVLRLLANRSDVTPARFEMSAAHVASPPHQCSRSSRTIPIAACGSQLTQTIYRC
jgi:hypothetical protein